VRWGGRSDESRLRPILQNISFVWIKTKTMAEDVEAGALKSLLTMNNVTYWGHQYVEAYVDLVESIITNKSIQIFVFLILCAVTHFRKEVRFSFFFFFFLYFKMNRLTLIFFCSHPSISLVICESLIYE
jgi:hypothetical protein